MLLLSIWIFLMVYEILVDLYVSFSLVIKFLSFLPVLCWVCPWSLKVLIKHIFLRLPSFQFSVLDRHVVFQACVPPSGKNSCWIKDLEWKLFNWTSFRRFILLNHCLCTWNNLKAFINIWWHGESHQMEPTNGSSELKHSWSLSFSQSLVGVKAGVMRQMCPLEEGSP